MYLESWKSHCKNFIYSLKFKGICDVSCLMLSYSLVSILKLMYNDNNDKITPPTVILLNHFVPLKEELII
jgi:hypothetical protein